MALRPVLYDEAGDRGGALRGWIAVRRRRNLWVDLRAAYARLPRQLRAAIAGKRGIFDYAKRLAGYGRETDRQISEEARRLTPAVTHALVRAHPETGDRSLYLDSTLGLAAANTSWECKSFCRCARA
jgi:alpha-ketoglutarate-dependent taurine dioxygenase